MQLHITILFIFLYPVDSLAPVHMACILCSFTVFINLFYCHHSSNLKCEHAVQTCVINLHSFVFYDFINYCFHRLGGFVGIAYFTPATLKCVAYNGREE